MNSSSQIVSIFECFVCDAMLKDWYSLNEHIKSEHLSFLGKSHECNKCGRSFSTKHSLRSHKLIHATNKTYQCRNCVKEFIFKKQLNKHFKTMHWRENLPYKCKVCDQGLDNIISINKHTRLHKKIRRN